MAARPRITQNLRRASRPGGFCTKHITIQTPLSIRCLSSAGSRPFKYSGRSLVKFTSETYPSLKRDSRFGQLTEKHVAYFKDVLGDGGVIDGVTTEAASDDIE